MSFAIIIVFVVFGLTLYFLQTSNHEKKIYEQVEAIIGRVLSIERRTLRTGPFILIFINGTMGVGKTTTSRELQKLLPKNVFLDGDWFWDMSPFVITEETKAMVLDNISYLLNRFISCSEYENIIFCWVMHEQSIIDDVLSRLNIENCNIKLFSLVCNKEALINRLLKDVQANVRAEDIVLRSIARIEKYSNLDTKKIDVSYISAKEAAKIISARL